MQSGMINGYKLTHYQESRLNKIELRKPTIMFDQLMKFGIFTIVGFLGLVTIHDLGSMKTISIFNSRLSFIVVGC